MLSENIAKLVQYGIECGLTPECERTYTTNLLLEVFGEDEYAEPSEEYHNVDLESTLKELLDEACSRGIIEDSIVYRDLFDTKLMNCLMPRPAQVQKEFAEKYEQSPQAATDYFYKLSQDSDYIRRYRVCKDRRWTVESDYGTIDITINLSKPEKDPKAIAAAKNAKVPVAVHFDHGKTIEKITQALEIGFTSVMFDGSHLPLDENIEFTKKIIEIARKYDASVEAEIGCVGGSEDGSEDIAINCTKPEDAVKFENETSVDELAIAIGNAHGNYKSTPKLRFDILSEVEQKTHTPLVLHGGTGISPYDFVKCSKTGIKKINIATATFDRVEQSVRSAYESGSINGYYDLQGAEVEGAYQNAKKHILIFGTDNKA